MKILVVQLFMLFVTAEIGRVQRLSAFLQWQGRGTSFSVRNKLKDLLFYSVIKEAHEVKKLASFFHFSVCSMILFFFRTFDK